MRHPHLLVRQQQLHVALGDAAEEREDDVVGVAVRFGGIVRVPVPVGPNKEGGRQSEGHTRGVASTAHEPLRWQRGKRGAAGSRAGL